MKGREIILYATPVGDLADACERFYAAADRVAATAAQQYPPHCTLTGFFHRDEPRATEVIAEIGARIEAAGVVPSGAIEVTELMVENGWVGLVLRSPWLIELTDGIIAEHRLADGDDALRAKRRLHLSLAYDVDDVTPYADLAREMVDPEAYSAWEVALWERLDSGRWTRLT